MPVGGAHQRQTVLDSCLFNEKEESNSTPMLRLFTRRQAANPQGVVRSSLRKDLMIFDAETS
jgi:hypothetical protein